MVLNINTPFVHVYVTRFARLQSLTLTRKLCSSGHLAPGRPAVLALMRRRRRQRRWSGGSPHLLSSQSLCIRRETPKETPTDVRHQTQSHTTTRTPRHPPPRPKPHSFGRAVCGLRFDNPERIIADLSIGTLRLCGLFDCLGAV